MGLRRDVLASGPTWRLLVDKNERLYYEYQIGDDCSCCFSLLCEVAELYQRRFYRALQALKIRPIYVNRDEIKDGIKRWACYEARRRCATTTWDAEQPYRGPVKALTLEVIRDADLRRFLRPRAPRKRTKE